MASSATSRPRLRSAHLCCRPSTCRASPRRRRHGSQIACSTPSARSTYAAGGPRSGPRARAGTLSRPSLPTRGPSPRRGRSSSSSAAALRPTRSRTGPICSSCTGPTRRAARCGTSPSSGHGRDSCWVRAARGRPRARSSWAGSARCARSPCPRSPASRAAAMPAAPRRAAPSSAPPRARGPTGEAFAAAWERQGRSRSSAARTRRARASPRRARPRAGSSRWGACGRRASRK
mmetsp:Transcript_11549/g.36602  ORF Transcript_11549/g.36602 Transcript_11549/m.36602 type:complete len:233 (-) Transcript_11549:668-1366(-)